ncbi:hypothetical protein B0H14DRAFT_1333620 [Mycena olivaceomarginata]|nr:hypothetical protein B0H14DRAFT_1333620 [Mycena olivaceomarginata]
MDDDPMNYHPSTSSSTHPRFALRPRALQSAAALPLSSLAPSSSGDNILAATLLDISSASSMSASSSGDQAQQPQSKSEQDLARYLATSNPPQAQGDASLSREETLLHRDFRLAPGRLQLARRGDVQQQRQRGADGHVALVGRHPRREHHRHAQHEHCPHPCRPR